MTTERAFNISPVMRNSQKRPKRRFKWWGKADSKEGQFGIGIWTGSGPESLVKSFVAHIVNGGANLTQKQRVRVERGCDSRGDWRRTRS